MTAKLKPSLALLISLSACSTKVVTRGEPATTPVNITAEEGFALSNVKVDNVSSGFLTRRFFVSTGPHIATLNFSVVGRECPPRSYSCASETQRGRCDVPFHATGTPIVVTIQRSSDEIEARVESQSGSASTACRIESSARRYDQRLFDTPRFYNE